MAVRLGQQLLVWLWTLPLIAKCLRGRISECDKAGLNARLDINHREEPEPGAHRIVVFKPLLRVGSTGVCLDVDRMMHPVAGRVGKEEEDQESP